MTNKDIYRQLCKQKSLPLFMQPWWMDAVCTEWDVVLAKKGDMITGAWVYPVEKKIGVPMLRNPMLTPYLGPQVFFPSDLKESNFDNYEHEVISELMAQLPSTEVWHLAIQPGIKQVGIFKNNDLNPQVQQTFLIDLHAPEETLLSNMKEATRRNIRAAEKEIIITDSPEHLKDLFRFQKETMEKKSKPAAYTLKYLQKIMDACLAHHAGALWVAKVGDSLQAIVWHVWDDKCSYYFMGGQNHEVNNSRAMTALLWHAVKDARKKGHTTFDLEGSMDAGVERFFRSFGGERSLYLVLLKNDSVIWKLKKMILK